MRPGTVTSIRELTSRTACGLQVRLLWCREDGRLWVAVVDIRTGESFRIEVHPGERPLDVFHHPFAYAALRDDHDRIGACQVRSAATSRLRADAPLPAR